MSWGTPGSLSPRRSTSWGAEELARRSETIEHLRDESGALKAVATLSEQRFREVLMQHEATVEEKAHVQEKLATVQAERRALDEASKRAEQRFAQEVGSMQARLDLAEERNRELMKQREEEHAAKCQVTERLAVVETSRDALEGLSGRLDAQLKTELEEKARLRAECAAATSTLAEAAVKREAEQKEGGRVAEALASVRAENRVSEEMARLAEQKHADDRAAVQARADAAERRCGELRAQAEAAAQERLQTAQALTAAQAEKASLQEQLAVTQAERAAAVELSRRVEVELQQARGALHACGAQADERCGELSQQKEALQSERSRALEQLAGLEAERRGHEDSARRAEAALQQALGDRSGLQARAELAEDKWQRAVQQSNALSAEKSELQSKLGRATEALAATKEQLAASRAEAAAAHQLATKAGDEKAAVEGHARYVEERCKTLQSQQAASEQERGRLAERVAACEAEAKAAEQVQKRREEEAAKDRSLFQRTLEAVEARSNELLQQAAQQAEACALTREQLATCQADLKGAKAAKGVVEARAKQLEEGASALLARTEAAELRCHEVSRGREAEVEMARRDQELVAVLKAEKVFADKAVAERRKEQEATLEAMQRQCEDMQKQTELFVAERDDAKKDAAARQKLEVQLAETLAEKRATEAIMARISDELKQTRDEAARAALSHDEKRRELDAATVARAEAHRLQLEAQTTAATREEECAKLREGSAALHERIGTLEREREQAGEASSSHALVAGREHEQLREAQTELERLREEAQRAADEREAMTTHYKRLDAELATYTAQREHEQRERGRFEAAASEAHAEREALQHEVAALRHEKRQLEEMALYVHGLTAGSAARGGAHKTRSAVGGVTPPPLAVPPHHESSRPSSPPGVTPGSAGSAVSMSTPPARRRYGP